MSDQGQKSWWRGAVVYQIYPRSFKDSNGDGVGDLKGIIEKLDYLKDLGVDALWISPFFTSPMKDFGYDVADYCGIDPLFGTMEDFDRLMVEAHARGLKIIIDQVWAHSSDAHAWFKESRQSRDNPKADWYIWADPKPDGTAPNNWLSYFGGPAWQWDTRRRQYYLHHFLVSQPALNLRSPGVLDALEKTARFWFDKGVDGFRLDAIQAYLCDLDLRDNPARTPEMGGPSDMPPTNPLSMQLRVNSNSHPEIFTLAEKLRAIADSYPERMLLAEVGGEKALEDAVKLVQTGKRLHLAYTFSLFSEGLDEKLIRSVVEQAEGILGDGWLCWATSNHDVERAASRWYNPAWRQDGVPPSMLAKLALAMGLSLRGSFCLYQGEELALTEADVPFEKMQDPYGIEFYPEFKGRDGCRTPMPWDQAAPNGGFTSSATPWLPIPGEHLALAAAAQERDPASPLAFAKNFIAWRKTMTPLVSGEMAFLEAPEGMLAFERSAEGQTILCVFNLTPTPLALPLSAVDGDALEGHGFAPAAVKDGTLTLGGLQGFFARKKS